MKHTIYLFLILGCLHSCQQKPAAEVQEITTITDTVPPMPVPQGMVSDYAGIFTAEQVKALESLVLEYEKRTTNEIGVAVIDSTMADSTGFEDFTLNLASTWGVGKKGKHNGVLIVIAPHLRRIRIQNGRGIEKIFTSEETQQVIDSVFVPQFRTGGYFRGTSAGIQAIIRELDQQQEQK
ncbi:MAG TPA: TPM domain-containing protein [Chitinophagaceae bacterium]|nr:TPM domain-containing protein [Chitinophagaceae bacterium]